MDRNSSVELFRKSPEPASLVALGGMMLALCATGVRAQTPGVDGYNSEVPTSVLASSLALQSDGKILAMGGPIGASAGQSAGTLARFYPDGRRDPTFKTTNTQYSYNTLLQPDGKILLGGLFSFVGAEPRYSIARLNADGTLDDGFKPGNAGAVWEMVLQPDGKIIAGGNFTVFCGVPRTHLARLDSDGTVDMGFAPASGSMVRALALEDDGRILVARDGDAGSQNVMRLNQDGSVVSVFAITFSGYSHITKFFLQTDGKVVVLGDFTSINGLTRNYIGRLNTDGTLDTTFAPNPNGSVETVMQQADGMLLVGGRFSVIGGVSRPYLARLNANGSVDASFAPTANGYVSALMAQTDGRLVVSGGFTTLGGQARPGFGRLEASGPVTDLVARTAGGVGWSRGGCTIALQRVLFEHSQDGKTWTSLGTGVRSGTDWNWEGAVPTGGVVRAKGYASNLNECGGWLYAAEEPTAPLLSGPEDQSVAADAGARLVVVPFGGRPFTCQWRKEGVNLSDGPRVSGSASDRLDLSNLTVTDAGNYDVIVSNSAGSVTSRVAVLTVIDPAITGQPVDTGGFVGSDASFSVTAAGTGLAYQWRRNSQTLAIATNRVLTLSNLQYGDSGAYDCLVTGTHGTVSSRVAVLSVIRMDDAFTSAADSTIYAMSAQSEGRTLVGGNFTSLGGLARQYIARLESSGAVDPDFNPGANAAVTGIAVQADEKILLAGSFTSLAGQVRNFLARLNPDGTLDDGFNPGANAGVTGLAIQPDGNFLVVGSFTMIGGVSRPYVARLSPGGVVDTGFLPVLDGAVNTVAVQSDGKIILGGEFSTANGIACTKVVRLNADGSLDRRFLGTVSGTICSILIQPDEKILLAGRLDLVNATNSKPGVARLDTDGALDVGFHAGANHGSTVNAIALQADGKIWIGGDFTTLSGTATAGLARLNQNGSLDLRCIHGPSPSPVSSITLDASGHLLVSGAFTTLGGEARTRFARIDLGAAATNQLSATASSLIWTRTGSLPEIRRAAFEHTLDGTSWNLIGEGIRISTGWRLDAGAPVGGVVRARGYAQEGYRAASCSAIDRYMGPPLFSRMPPDRHLDAGQLLSLTAGVVGSEPLTWQWRKNSVPLMNAGKVSGATGSRLEVSGVLEADEGSYDVVVTNALGSITSRVAVVTVNDPVLITQPVSAGTYAGGNLTLGVGVVGTQVGYQWFRNGVSLAGQTNAVLQLSGIQSAAMGDYTVVAGNAYGSVTSQVAVVGVVEADAAFNPRPNSAPSAVAVQPDGRILVAGGFSQITGVSKSYLARLLPDGSLDPSYAPAPNASVSTLALQPDGACVVGGSFNTIGGQSRNALARLNRDGTVDAAFNPAPNGSVSRLAVQTDGKILVSGSFTQIAGQARSYLARLNADGSFDPTFVVTASAVASTLTVQPDGRILVGGSLTITGSPSRSYLVRLDAGGGIDPTFQPVLNNAVSSVLLLPDNRMVIAGTFTTVGGFARARMAILNADGTPDPVFNPAPNNAVTSLVLQANGVFFAGGNFSTIGGLSRPGLARFLPDGTLDVSFNSSATSAMNTLTLSEDGSLLVGGTFTTLAGLARTNFARLKPWAPSTQGLDFPPQGLTWTRTGGFSELTTCVLHHSPDGVVWNRVASGARVPGGWTFAGVGVTTGVYRVSGFATGGYNNNSTGLSQIEWGGPRVSSQPAAVTANAGSTVEFSAAAVGSAPFGYQWRRAGVPLADGGRVGGATTAKLSLANVLKADEDGYDVVVSNSLGSVTSSVAVLTVRDPWIHVHPASQVLLPGNTLSLSVTAAGTGLTYQWRKGSEPIPGSTGSVFSLPNVQNDELGSYDVVVTGTHGSLTSSVAVIRFALFDPGFTPNVESGSVVTCVTVQPDRRILIGGTFTTVGGQPYKRLARLLPSGTLDLAFHPDPDNYVQAITLQPDGKILVAGNFTTICGQSRARMARLNRDGTLDASFTPPFTQANTGYVNSILVLPTGKILWTASMASSWQAGRLNADGASDASFSSIWDSSGISGSRIDSIAVQSDQKILVGGSFYALNGVTRGRLARFQPDGAMDSTPTRNLENDSFVVRPLPDGKILTAGRSGMIARLSSAGVADATFHKASINNDGVYSMVVQEDGKMFISGGFTTVDGNTRTHLAMLNPDGMLNSEYNLPINGSSAWSLAFQSDGQLLVAGDFTQVDGFPRSGIVRLPASVPAQNELSAGADAVQWTCAGSMPQFWRTTLEHSGDGVAWTALGAGARGATGWHWDGAFATTGVFRAQGYAAGSHRSCSHSILETRLEFDTDSDTLPDWWETLHFGDTLSATAAGDPDTDGMDNRTEYLAGTLPHDPASLLIVRPPDATAGFTISWPCVPGRTYQVQYADSPGSVWYEDLPGSLVTAGDTQTLMTYTDTTLGPGASRVYRVGVLNDP